MTKMQQAEKEEFLAGLHVGVLGLNDPGAGPLTVPIWYDYTPGQRLWVLTGENSRKAKLINQGTRLSLAAQSEDLPYKYVSIEGVVEEITPTTTAELEAMAIRYLGETQGKAYASASSAEGQITVWVKPERWLAVDYAQS
ncbi:MAG: pyridoxamine 5'-phosphate oxidase family protein [Pseudomonadota bacterium]